MIVYLESSTNGNGLVQLIIVGLEEQKAQESYSSLQVSGEVPTVYQHRSSLKTQTRFYILRNGNAVTWDF